MAQKALKTAAPKKPVKAPPSVAARQRTREASRWALKLPALGDFTLMDLGILFAVAVAIAVAGIAMVRLVPFMKIAEQWLIDFRLTTLSPGQSDTHPSIVVVTATEETLATLEYRSPVDRAFLAQVVNTLREKGAYAIGLDFLFDQPTVKQKDDALRAALNAWPVPPVVAWAGYEEGLTKKQVDTMTAFFDGIRIRRGFATLDTDEDGTVRAIFPGQVDPVSKQWEPGFAGALAAQIGADPPRQAIGLSYLTRGWRNLKAPVFEEYEAHLIGELPAQLFKGKTVLIGVNLPDSDRHRTPLAAALGHGAGSLPGVVVHAQALSQLLDGRRLPRVNGAMEIVLTLVAAVVAIGLILLETRAWLKLAASAVMVAGFLFVVSVPIYFGGALLPLLAPVIAFLGALTAGSVYVARRYRDKKRFIRDAFSRYVEPKVVAQLLENPAALVTEGEMREMTLLFTDLENFTVLSEGTQPQVLVRMMGQYFDGMCDILIKRGGTIDKFIGDAVVAIFGAPATVPDHAQRAVEAAIEIRRFTEQFREKARQEFGLKLGQTRIGVHTGNAIVGNFGSTQRHNYTAMGDTVNTAARLEGANKRLGTAICVSDAAARQCRKINFMPLGTLELKGKTSRVDAFTPVETAQSSEGWFRDYMDAFRLLREGKAEAADAFARVGAGTPAAPLAALHAKRMQAGKRDLLVGLE